MTRQLVVVEAGLTAVFAVATKAIATGQERLQPFDVSSPSKFAKLSRTTAELHCCLLLFKNDGASLVTDGVCTALRFY